MTREKLAPTVRTPGNEFQRETARIIKGLSTNPLNDGVLLEGIDLSTTSTRVFHRLGRPMRGFLVVDCDADTRVFRSSVSNTESVEFTANATRTVSLWIF